MTARRRMATIAVFGIVAACGSGGEDAAVTTLQSATSSTARVTTTTARVTTTTTVPGPRIEASDAVIVDCDDGIVEVMRARPASQERLTNAYRVDIRAALEEIGLSGSVSGCSGRHYFNQDFSKLIANGDETGGASHAVVVDLATGKAIDLTASRQGSGFSGGEPLDEAALAFEAPPDALRFTDRVVVSSGSTVLLIDPANPSAVVNFPGGYDAAESLQFASGVDYTDDFHARAVLSPDGRFIVSTGLGAPGHITTVATDEGHSLPYDCSNSPEGWRDAQTAVVRGRDTFYLVPIDGNGVPGSCVPIFPASDREFGFGRLRLDGQVLFVSVEGAEGEEFYAADLANPGAEPTSGSPTLVMQPNWRVYHPRTP